MKDKENREWTRIRANRMLAEICVIRGLPSSVPYMKRRKLACRLLPLNVYGAHFGD